MANGSITADVAVSAAAFAQAARKYYWDATTLGNGPTKRMLEWKDWIDAVVTALQAEVGTGGALEVESLTASGDLTVTDLVTAGRLDLSLGAGLNANGTDFTLSAGWGDEALVNEGSVTGTAARFSLTIVIGSTNLAADPTITLTFPTARSTSPTMAIPVIRNYNAAAGITGITVDALSTTLCRLQVIGTPVASEAVTFDCLLIG